MDRVIVVGIGQPFRGDDALGLAALKAWQAKHGGSPPEVDIRLLESPGLNLLEALAGYSTALIVDAIATGAEPGTILRLKESDLAAFAPGAGSAHGLGVAETLAIGRRLEPTNLPSRIDFIGIEVADLAIGQPLTAAGRGALPAAVQAIDDALDGLRKTADGELPA
jgi:hydrogenase maturation protease